ncbi:pilus assembly protein PilX [Psychrobacter sp. SCQQ22]|uniref:pilus assembly protein PilX n=1 Tax=Psychrobacter sp. SCQQ22 TaxID=2792059 RepID=UPI0018CE67FD|nr:pilus assembly protein PilX [Psychrobacter sp. SCQQ22]MBH0084966.1 pilus assembly protein PilX [Psychrobacter sp. SCQQ22]
MTHYHYPSNLKAKNVDISLTYRSTEQGATLVVVLLFLVLIMLAGAIAVRQSNTDLKIATSDQINTVLLQSSDSANQKLEAMINGSSTSTEYLDVTSVAGVFGHFLLNEENSENEFIYCFNPRTKKYLTANATVRQATGGYWSSLNNGICDYTSADGYTSARQTVVTQISVTTTPTAADAEAFGHMVLGKEVEDRTSKKYQFDIRATSALPSYSEPVDTEGSCFAKTSISANVASGKNSLNDCMLAATTPSKMLYEQADVENVSSSTLCIPFGTGSGSLDTQCVLSTTP